MKVLVTGAAGFIGSNLAEKLAKRGDEVIGLDNFNDYYDPQRKRSNERQLNKYSNFKMIEADVRDRLRMLDVFAEEKFDCVAHLAAMAGVRNAITNPSLYIDVNYGGTLSLLEAARNTGNIRNFILASTSTVYGNTAHAPFVETEPCAHPLQPYAASKRGAEILGYTYHYLFGISFTVLRFFTVYGPNGRPDMMAYRVAESISKGTLLPVYNNGEMYRDWTYVEDITDGILLALDKPLGYEIFNLGRGEVSLLNDFIREMEELAGRRANRVNTPKLPTDIERAYADITKARSVLQYQPRVSVAQGVSEFWAWYEKHEDIHLTGSV